MSDKKQHTGVFTDSIIKVSGSSNPQSVGSILARAISAGQTPKMRAIGASAVNQAVKACAIARGFVAPRGLDISYIIGFDDIIGDNGDQISAMFFREKAHCFSILSNNLSKVSILNSFLLVPEKVFVSCPIEMNIS